MCACWRACRRMGPVRLPPRSVGERGGRVGRCGRIAGPHRSCRGRSRTAGRSNRKRRQRRRKWRLARRRSIPSKAREIATRAEAPTGERASGRARERAGGTECWRNGMRRLVACMQIFKTGGGIIYRWRLTRSSAFTESRLPEHLKIHVSGRGILVGREEAGQVRLMGIQFATDAFPLGVEPWHQTLSPTFGLSGLGLDYTPQMEDLANGSGLSRLTRTPRMWFGGHAIG